MIEGSLFEAKRPPACRLREHPGAKSLRVKLTTLGDAPPLMKFSLYSSAGRRPGLSSDTSKRTHCLSHSLSRMPKHITLQGPSHIERNILLAQHYRSFKEFTATNHSKSAELKAWLTRETKKNLVQLKKSLLQCKLNEKRRKFDLRFKKTEVTRIKKC